MRNIYEGIVNLVVVVMEKGYVGIPQLNAVI